MSESLARTIAIDHEYLQGARDRYDARFDAPASTTSALLVDLARNIGFQQLAVFRIAQAAHRRGFGPAAMIVSRMIRHVYGAEMHWAADVEAGVVLVHGNGLVISREARVGRGCVLSQNVTLGISAGDEPGTSGAPRLDDNVHVGPGAVLAGPITIGRDSKIAPNATVLESVGERSVVRPSEPVITSRGGATPRRS